MFKKLVSNLPFQPSLLGDVSFYISRLKQEEIIRRFGVLLLLIGFGLQIFTVAFPPQATLATHRSDIIYGASTKTDVLSAYRRNEDQLGRKDIRAIFNNYGIGEAQIQNAKKVTISDGDSNYINTSRNISVDGTKFVPISGAVDGGIYEFPLTYWRKNEYPNGYPALTGLSTYGFRFWILLKGCGNIVYEKGAKKPNLEVTKTRTSGSQGVIGSTVNYEIKFRNTGAIGAKDTVIKDTLPSGLEYQTYSSNIDLKLSQNGNNLQWKIDNKNSVLGAGSKWYYIKLSAKASATNPKLCNTAIINASNATKASTEGNDACVKIITATCPGTGLPIPSGGIANCSVVCQDGSSVAYNQTCPKPQLSCQEIVVTKNGSWDTRQLNIKLIKQPGASVERVDYLVNGITVKSVAGNTADDYTYMHTFSSEGNFSIQAKVVSNNSNVTEDSSCSVVESVTKPKLQELIIATDKKVSNITQSIDDANNTTANPGDVLKYTIFVYNKGTAVINNLELTGEYSEDINDILEYSDVKNLYDGILNKDTGKLSWSAVTIEPGQSISKQFEVTVKNPLPNTPVSASNPLSYDYVMFNAYGRSVNVKLNKSTVKEVEQAVSTLPNTGPSASLMATLAVVIIAGYFYFRNRILAKELIIIRKEFSSGGI